VDLVIWSRSGSTNGPTRASAQRWLSEPNCYTTSVTLPIPMVDDAALRRATVRTLPLMSWGSCSATSIPVDLIDGSRVPRIEAARSIQQQCIQTIDFQGEIRGPSIASALDCLTGGRTLADGLIEGGSLLGAGHLLGIPSAHHYATTSVLGVEWPQNPGSAVAPARRRGCLVEQLDAVFGAGGALERLVSCHVPCRSQQLARTTMATATRLCRAAGMSCLIRRMTWEEKRG
jgi:hypothetical protein